MRILYMCLQAIKILWALLLFNIAICMAPPPAELNPARSDKKGIQITEASCNGRIYEEELIYQATNDGWRFATKKREEGYSIRKIRYYVKVIEDMPTQGPFYYYQIYPKKRFADNYRDFVIFNLKGELAKVVTGTRQSPASPWKFKDCTVVFFKMPAVRTRIKEMRSLEEIDKQGWPRDTDATLNVP